MQQVTPKHTDLRNYEMSPIRETAMVRISRINLKGSYYDIATTAAAAATAPTTAAATATTATTTTTTTTTTRLGIVYGP
jgi:hypothetical protein